MSGYLADFITGRSIGEGERIVAFVIIPTEAAWKDGGKSAAHPPCYPHDRFMPLSLPLVGGMDDDGFFIPDHNQVSLGHLLSTTRFESWHDFRRAMNPRDNSFELSHPDPEMATRFNLRRQVVPGLSVMHQSTFCCIVGLSGIEEDPTEAAARAALIAMDASERVANRELDYIALAKLGKPYGRGDYELLSGRTVPVPMVSGVFSETAPWEISHYARDAIGRAHRDSHLTDGTALRQTFEALGDFQRFCIGLSVLNRYFEPSIFTRHDNLFEAAEVQLNDIENAVQGISSRRAYGPAYVNNAGDQLAALATRLRATLDAVEWEMASYPVYGAYKERTP
ncbi:hypothetical protein [Rhizobium sp. BK176]|uniref:hypothetical protein n=1 Tax=Rhizobium sp. BK176 TaxID=2587071 RepID=UPI0021678344|nr:hypothetical protein [Rhizobium sp. BK176]MCS4090126.1 hypothetical protein [Rhizobium sp. BK176]